MADTPESRKKAAGKHRKKIVRLSSKLDKTRPYLTNKGSIDKAIRQVDARSSAKGKAAADRARENRRTKGKSKVAKKKLGGTGRNRTHTPEQGGPRYSKAEVNKGAKGAQGDMFGKDKSTAGGGRSKTAKRKTASRQGTRTGGANIGKATGGGTKKKTTARTSTRRTSGSGTRRRTGSGQGTYKRSSGGKAVRAVTQSSKPRASSGGGGSAGKNVPAVRGTQPAKQRSTGGRTGNAQKKIAGRTEKVVKGTHRTVDGTKWQNKGKTPLRVAGKVAKAGAKKLPYIGLALTAYEMGSRAVSGRGHAPAKTEGGPPAVRGTGTGGRTGQAKRNRARNAPTVAEEKKTQKKAPSVQTKKAPVKKKSNTGTYGGMTSNTIPKSQRGKTPKRRNISGYSVAGDGVHTKTKAGETVYHNKGKKPAAKKTPASKVPKSKYNVGTLRAAARAVADAEMAKPKKTMKQSKPKRKRDRNVAGKRIGPRRNRYSSGGRN